MNSKKASMHLYPHGKREQSLHHEPDSHTSRLERQCKRNGMKMTPERRAILIALSHSNDHPSAFEILQRTRSVVSSISIGTVYRALAAFEKACIVRRLQFGAERARYELADSKRHDHLIDLQSGKVIKFQDDALDALKAEIVGRFGYCLSGARIEIYANSKERTDKL